MSDENEFYKILKFEKYKHCVRVDTKHCLQYARRKCSLDKDIILTVCLPYESLREWGDARKKASILPCGPCSYIRILNAFLYENCGFKVKEGCQRVENRLEKACSEVRAKFVGKNGTTYRKLCQKEIKLALQMDELVTVGEIEAELVTEKIKSDKLKKVKENLQQRCEDLVEALSEAQMADRASSETLSNAEREIEELKLENKNLHCYVEKLGPSLDFQNSGKKLTDVGGRHQRRKLTELKTYVEKALWFATTFGLDLTNVSFVDGQRLQHTLCYSNKEKKSYKDLSEEDQLKIKSILYILDKFCIGDAAYHELTMVCENRELPRSYLIKQCKDEMNKMSHITRTPGIAEGAQVDFNVELETVVQNLILQNVINVTDPEFKLHIKISGDGAKMSRVTSFVVISFSVMNNQKDIMSSKGMTSIFICLYNNKLISIIFNN